MIRLLCKVSLSDTHCCKDLQKLVLDNQVRLQLQHGLLIRGYISEWKVAELLALLQPLLLLAHCTT